MIADKAPQTHMVGYARVSMSDQDNRRQIDELMKFGVNESEIWTDSASGRNMNRPGWQKLWKQLQPGDLLVIHSVDRLGRDLVEVIRTIRDMEERGVGLKVLTMDIDTRTATGRLIFGIIAAMAQWERELIVERTRHGLKVARERGKVGGRKKTVEDTQVASAAKRAAAGEAVTAIAKEFGVSRQALNMRLKRAREAKRDKMR